MCNISSLDDLIKAVGKQETDILFTEYFMLMIEKAKLFDVVVSVLNNNGSIDEIKEVIKGVDD